MSKNGGSLDLDPLFLGLTRPAMIAGVTYTFFALNFMICTLGFVITSKFSFFMIGFVIHLIGVFICKKEPLAVEILFTKIQKCPLVRNNKFHGGLNSYNIF